MKLKKLTSVLLAAALAAGSLAACGSPKETPTTAAPAVTEAAKTTEAAKAAETTEAAKPAADLGTPVADVRVRQAPAYAIDMKSIVDSLFEGKAEVAKSFTAPGECEIVDDQGWRTYL